MKRFIQEFDFGVHVIHIRNHIGLEPNRIEHLAQLQVDRKCSDLSTKKQNTLER